MSYERRVLLKIVNILISIKCVESALLYPQYTVMQLIGSISAPVTDLPQVRKAFFDWGLQMNYDMPYNLWSFYNVPIWATNGSRSLLFNSRAVHKHDFTAKELYEGLENMLERYGYDRSCLKESICELSQHPFDEAHGNVVTDVINFFLTPSIHQGFLTEEKSEELVYKLAENQGYMGNKCRELYPQCLGNLFNVLTITDFMNN